MFALIDGNNFFCSAERAFRPSLQGKPLVVLSNNDGCAIARSEEAKALGVKMGQPFFEIRHLQDSAGLICLSANFELYGDVSNRMMSLAAGLGPSQEIYSIDESFIGDLEGVRDLTRRAWAVRARIEQWVGIPTCVGLAPTKTLAKLCNHAAKDAERKPGSYPAQLARVCNWNEMDAGMREDILRRTPAGEVWGIGRRIAAGLAEHSILSALDVARMPEALARREWGVMLARTVRELQGISCTPLELAPQPKQQIACTRSFGASVSALQPLIEAVSEFATRASEKLRRGGQRAGTLHVFARTSPFRPVPQFSRSASIQLVPPSSDTKQLVAAAVRGMRAIYAPGFEISKAGVMLLDLTSEQGAQLDLLAPVARDQSTLMETMDKLNARYGKGTLQVGSVATPASPHGGWRMKQERRTPRYTTRLDEIPIARA